MKKVLHYIFLICLFLNFSEGFRPVGVLLGLSSSALVSGFTLALNIVYVIVYQASFRVLLKNKIFLLWFILLIVYPIVAMSCSVMLGFLSINDFFYWTSLNTMYGSLMVGAGIYALNTDFSEIKKFAWLAVIVAIIGFVINYQLYSFSQKVLKFSNAGSANKEELYRALSFFPNANTAALSLIIYFLLLFSLNDNKQHKPIFYLLLLLLLSGLVFLTGSRTSIILVGIISAFFLFPLVNKQLSNRYNFSKFLSQTVTVLVLVTLSLVFINFLSFFSTFYEKLMSANILNRMNFFAILISGNEVEDASLSYRTQILPKYFLDISANPIFGYGPQFVRDKLASGEFRNVSQNAFIENAIIYGVPYSILLLYSIVVTYIYSAKQINYKLDLFNAFSALIVFLFLISFSINGLFWIRSCVICLGLLVGQNIKDRFLLSVKEINGTADSDREY